VRQSKLIALALRHDPRTLGLELDSGGWADVDELIRGLRAQGLPMTRRTLGELVATSEKKRFAISEDGEKIRANQGHSITVDLGLVRREPPPTLFHGTIRQNLGRIRTHGLLPGSPRRPTDIPFRGARFPKPPKLVRDGRSGTCRRRDPGCETRPS
jgi:putative RNA 2'-phosphotransferase